MNKCELVGRLTKDPELKFTAGSGTAVCSFTLAVDRKFVNQSTGQREADFISIVCWRKTAEFVCNYFKKGNPIEVMGSIQVRKYQAQDGTDRYATEVVADEVGFVVGAAKKDGSVPADKDAPPAPKGSTDPMGDGGYVAMDDEDIPF